MFVEGLFFYVFFVFVKFAATLVSLVQYVDIQCEILQWWRTHCHACHALSRPRDDIECVIELMTEALGEKTNSLFGQRFSNFSDFFFKKKFFFCMKRKYAKAYLVYVFSSFASLPLVV